jgi:hypothetical protein
VGRGKNTFQPVNASAFGGGRPDHEIEGVSIIDPDVPPDIGSETHRRRLAEYVHGNTGRFDVTVSLSDKCSCGHRHEMHNKGHECTVADCKCKKHIPSGGSFTDMHGNITVQSDRPPRGSLAEREIVINGLLRHEVGHEKLTDKNSFFLFNKELNKLRQNKQEISADQIFKIWNSIEDGRMEGVIRAETPGAYRFISGMNLLFKRVGAVEKIDNEYKVLLDDNIDYKPTDANGKKFKIVTENGRKLVVIPAGAEISCWNKHPFSLKKQMSAALLAESLPEYEVGEVHPKVRDCLDECQEHIDAALSGNTSDSIARAYAIHRIMRKHGLIDEDLTQEERDEIIEKMKEMKKLMEEMGEQQQSPPEDGQQQQGDGQPQKPQNGLPGPPCGGGGDEEGEEGDGSGQPGGSGSGGQEDGQQSGSGQPGGGGDELDENSAGGDQDDSDMPDSLRKALENGVDPNSLDNEQSSGGGGSDGDQEDGDQDGQGSSGGGGSDGDQEDGDGDQDVKGSSGGGGSDGDQEDGDQDGKGSKGGKDGDQDGEDGDGDQDGKGSKGGKDGDQDGDQAGQDENKGPDGDDKKSGGKKGSKDPSGGFNPQSTVPKEDRMRHEKEGRGSVSEKELKDMKKNAEQALTDDKNKQQAINNRDHTNNRFEADHYKLDVGKAIPQRELANSYARHGGALTDEQGELAQMGQQLARKLKKIKTEAKADTKRRKSGRLDTRAFSRGLAGDDRVYYRKGKSIELDMEIDVNMDRSGSIGGEETKNQYRMAKMLANAAQATKIPITIYGWDGGGGNVTHYAYKERHSNDLKAIDSLFQTGGGGTPTQEGIRLSRRRLANSKASDKMMVVLTDGESNDQHSTLAQVQAARSEGIRVIALGLADGCNPRMMEEQFGAGNWQIIQKFTDAPRIVGGLIEQAAEAMRQ